MIRKKFYQPKIKSHKRKIRASCRAYADRVRRALALLDQVEQRQDVRSASQRASDDQVPS